MQKMENELQSILQSKFGFKNFRPGQQEAITSLLTQGRVLCIQPTGHGKSLLYQLTSCVLGGVTLVISPLLALMRDQIDHLNKRFNISAAAINSDQDDEENAIAKQAVLNGCVQVLFIAPEQLDHVDRFQFLLRLPINLIVVDEAHCISTWGHDFRPSYRQILDFVHAVYEKNPTVKILGLTATADGRVERDISKQLSFSDGDVTILRETMNRPNILLRSIKVRKLPSKLVMCEKLLASLEGCGLIYCATRENCVLVAEYLQQRGLPIAAYHSGFTILEKRKLQQEFITDKYKALATTNALGMGIDKGNLRYIIHFDIPGSITAYYQEVGRCGRDGQPAQGILLYDPADRRIQEYFIDSAQPQLVDFQNILKVVKAAKPPPNLTMIKRLTGLHPTRVTTVIAELVEQKFLTKFSLGGSQVYQVLERQDEPDLARYIHQHEVKSKELKNILKYAEQNHQCRMSLLRNSLGDLSSENCGHCDVCRPQIIPLLDDKAVQTAETWIAGRPIPIPGYAINRISEGLSLLDGKMRSPQFVNFMKQRAAAAVQDLGMDEELVLILKKHADSLRKNCAIAGIVTIPSRTWTAKNKVYELLSQYLQVPLFDQLLSWKEEPPSRQGELLNNDQRHHNVHQRMIATLNEPLPKGTLILFDDYIGSGNTIKEAARALRATKQIPHELVPFTVAAIKWHLGKPGFS